MCFVSVEKSGSGHVDAVLSLSWNRAVRSVLASASADCSVKVWDMNGPRCVETLQHADKVLCFFSVVTFCFHSELGVYLRCRVCSGILMSLSC